MENRRLCTELPLFYEAAATAYANGKQYDKAFNVLNRGLLRLGSAVEDVYHRFAVKMEENVAQDRVKEEELSHRKAFTDLNRDELSAGFRRPSHRVERGLFTQKIKTTPCKTKPVFIAPDNVPIPEKDNKKICKEDEQKPEEPSKKKLRLIQSKIPEIRKGRAENIPMSERWSKVRIPQAHFLCSGSGSRTGGGGGRSLVTIFNDGAQTTENSKKEAMGYNKLILVSKDGEEQQFEEARMERYLKQIKIKKEESLEASTAQDAVDPYADRTSRTDLFNRLGTCPNIRLNQNESPIPDKSEVPLETIVSFLSEQRSISGNAKTAALYLLDEMLSCVICLRENEAIHGTISTKSFTYTTLLENNKVCERNRTLTDKFWHNRGLVLHGFGAKSIDVSSLCGKSCCGSWPPHLKPFQKSEHWLWDIDLAGVFEVMGKITGTDKEGATQNCSVALKPRTDVLAEFWGLDYERCSLDDLKELRGKIEKNLFGDRRKTVASKAALVWVELNLL